MYISNKYPGFSVQGLIYKTGLSGFFCLLLTMPVYADADAAGELELGQIIALAEKNSPLLLSMNSDLESLLYQKKQAGKSQNPSFGFDVGSRKAGNESGSEYSMQFEQPVYYPGRKALKQLLVENDAKIKEIQLLEATSAIRLNAVKFAYRYLIALEKKNHVKERLTRLALVENFINARPFFTPQAKADLFIIKRRILNLKKHFNDLDLGAANDFESLNLYLLLENKKNIRIPLYTEGKTYDFAVLQDKAMNRNQMVLAALGAIQKAKTELKLAQLEKYPDYAVIGQAGEDRSGVANQYFDLGLKFKVPLWDQFQNKVAAGEASLKAQQQKLEYVKNTVRMTFKQAWAGYEQSKTNLRLFNLSELNEIESDMNYADAEFRKGRIQLVSFLDLENQLHETHHAILDAQVAHIEALLNLLYITNEKNILEELNHAGQTFKYQLK